MKLSLYVIVAFIAATMQLAENASATSAYQKTCEDDSAQPDNILAA